MSIDCQCSGRTTAAFKAAALLHADAVRSESTLKRAAAIVFQATHDDKSGCGGCMGNIGRTLVELDLRPAAELEEFDLPHANCGNCTACSRFDFL